ncbi:MAG: TonB-dependent receptor [Bdellovibrionales bacterium]|nr:TonB-dependent receptor [Bdellovibrionales bacterium]
MSLLTLLLSLFLATARAEDDAPASATQDTPATVTLDPIISEGTTAESLKFDPVVPAYTAKSKDRASTGNVAKELSNDLPFHTNSNFKPGNEVGVIGIGKGPEETDVNLLGIPINRPQGGGADLATFPQYFWSGYSYQIGPSLGAFDPRGVGGSLTLRLWTQENLGTDSNRATAFHSTRHIQQFSYGRSGKRYAALAGITTDSVFGPGLSLSTIPLETGSLKITTHLIFSDTDAKNFLSERYPSNTASQRTDRLIPVVQIDKKLGASLLKTSFFYDFAYVDYDDSASPSSKQIKKVHQFGNESAYLFGSTRVGFGVRSVKYERNLQNAVGDFPSEQILNLQASHGFKFATSEKSDFLVEPTLGGYAVTRNGFYPTASLGMREEHRFENGGKCGEFLRAGFTKRFSSLLDRYYQFTQPAGPTTLVGLPNPDLQPENVRSVEFGGDFAKGAYKNQLTFFVRDYKHARYTRQTTVGSTTYYQMVNAGDAWVVGATQSQDWKAFSMVDLGTRLTYQRSQIEDLNTGFPYSPVWVGIVKADLHDPDNRYGLEIVNKGATEYFAYSETSSSSIKRLPSYYYLDLFARAEVHEGITVVAGVENVFDRPIQYRLTDPDEGRVYSVSATASF